MSKEIHFIIDDTQRKLSEQIAQQAELSQQQVKQAMKNGAVLVNAR